MAAGLALGFASGTAQTPPDDPTVLQKRYPGECPRGAVSSVFTTTVDVDDKINMDSTLKISMSGVTPYNAPSAEMLGTTDGASSLATCFVKTYNTVKQLRWSDGVFEMEIAISSRNADDLLNGIVEVDLGQDHSTVWIDLCRPNTWEGWDDGWSEDSTSICRADAQNRVVLNIKSPVENLTSAPFPSTQEVGEDGVETTWNFTGPPPPIKSDVAIPLDYVARTAISWYGSVYFVSDRSTDKPFDFNINLDLVYLADNWDVVLCLGVAAAVFVRLRGPTFPASAASSRPVARTLGWARSGVSESWRLVCIAAAVLVLGVQFNAFGSIDAAFGDESSFTMYYWPIASAVVVVLFWTLLGAAFATLSQGAALAASSIAAVALVVCLAYLVPEHQVEQQAFHFLAGFCVAFVVLLLTAGRALWNPIDSVFSGGDVGFRETPTTVVRDWAFIVAVATFTVAIGFPIGHLSSSAAEPWSTVRAAAVDLVWYMGYGLASTVRLIVILLIVAVLADKLMRVPAQRPVKSVSALSALLLTLCAPWNSNISLVEIVSLPVWLIQFWVLYKAFNYVADRVTVEIPIPVTREQRLAALRLAVPDFDETSPASASGSGRTPPTPAQQREAAIWFLQVGPRDGRTHNAVEAAQLAAAISVVPVGYIVWTTFTELGESLRTYSGLLLVALLALMELARWVFGGLIFGYFYEKLPGRVGAVKAIWFTSFWAVSCVGPVLIAHATGHNLFSETIFLTAQFGVFMMVLAVAFDYQTVRLVKGNFKVLQKLYGTHRYSDSAGALVSGVALVFALFQQLQAGAGTEVVSSLLSNLEPLLSLGRP